MAIHPLEDDSASTFASTRPLRSRLETARAQVLAAVRRHHACTPRLVGSLARGEEHPGSDVDLLVRFTPEATLLDEVGLRQELEDLLGVPVDVIGEDAVSGELRDRLHEEARPL